MDGSLQIAHASSNDLARRVTLSFSLQKNFVHEYWKVTKYTDGAVRPSLPAKYASWSTMEYNGS